MGIFSILFQQTKAKIGSITLDASVRETHLTTCDLTENPVEDGATITDHVRFKPVELTIDGVISNTPISFALINNITGAVDTVTSIFGQTNRSVEAYNNLLALQKSREPFEVITGLKRYTDMIMTSLSVPRDASTGNAIHFTAQMKQIIIAKTESSSLGLLDGNLGSSVSSLGSKTKSLGKKLTETVSSSSPLSSSPASVSAAGQTTLAKNTFDAWYSVNSLL